MQVTRQRVNMRTDNSKPDLKQTCTYNNSFKEASPRIEIMAPFQSHNHVVPRHDYDFGI